MEKMKNHLSRGTEPFPGGQNFTEQPNSGHAPADDILIARSRQGDMAAYGLLVQRYQHRLFNTVLRMVGHHDDALELTQEAFVRAMKGLKKFRRTAGFYTWLFRIAVNLCIVDLLTG